METVEIHDVHGVIWVVKQRDIVGARANNMNIGIFVRGIPETIYLGVDPERRDSVIRTLYALVDGELSQNLKLHSVNNH